MNGYYGCTKFNYMRAYCPYIYIEVLSQIMESKNKVATDYYKLLQSNQEGVSTIKRLSVFLNNRKPIK
jgi:hypothetical protein